MSFTMINFLSFVIYGNKTNRQTSITSECLEQQKINNLLYMRLMHASDTQPQL